MQKTIDTSIRKVYLSACKSYDTETLRAVLYPMLDGMLADNGIEKAELADKKVVLKPNLLAKREAEAGITTHPAFIAVCGSYFAALGAKVTVADSPGGVYNAPALDGIYRVTGMERACGECGATLNRDTSSVPVSNTAISPHHFEIIRPLAEADLIVNLCRLKTHALCQISAAVKNLFGSIPGLQKAAQHARFPARADFADMLCDLCRINAPQLNITDGVIGMEGNGPAGGTLREVGAVIASANPFASDLLAAYIMGFKPNEVGTVKSAVKRGFCPKEISELKIVGEAPEKFACAFQRPDASAGGLLGQLPTIFGGGLQKFLEPKPRVNPSKCIGCGECARNCPVSTIKVVSKKAHIEPSACIKCYCCQEFCPVKAIRVKSFFLFKF